MRTVVLAGYHISRGLEIPTDDRLFYRCDWCGARKGEPCVRRTPD